MWIGTSTRNISHRHTNTPFRYLLWSKLSHLVRGQTFEQEASKQSSKNSLTQWYIVVFGGRYSNGAWDPHQCPFCHTHTTLFTSQKVEMRDVRVCQMWNRMRDCFWWTWSNITLTAAMSQPRHCEIYIFFTLTSFSYFKIIKTPACLLCVYNICRTAAICFWFFDFFPSLWSLPIWSLSLQSFSMFVWAKMR